MDKGYVYVGQVKKHGCGKVTMSNGDVYVGKWRDDTPSDITLLSTTLTLNNNIQQLSWNVQSEPRPPSTNSNHRESLEEKFYARF